jgi:serine/threonine protein kinase
MSEPNPKTESLFWAALAIPSPAERAQYLDQVCGADPRLRAQLEELLAAYPKAERFLEVPATGVERPDPETPGTMIGPYKLLQQIGEGGMGTVFMAEQTQPVQRKVALKLIKPGMDSRQVIARFEAERQALALMDHPHIAKVLDAGATASGRPYFVMDLVKGLPITTYCDQCHLTPRQRLELFLPVCQAVQHAHQKGIIHRDLKPSNVLVALYDGKPMPKVIDFGVAKATGPKLTERTLFTEFGSVVGTLEYMSPEQAELNQLDIDTRSDIYSLGVLLYELLTGTTPLEQKRLKQAALLEVLRIIREDEPMRPSARLSTTEELPSIAANRGLEPKKLSGLVRGELDWIVMKCLEKDRARRYDTANGLGLDLQRYLADEPVEACPPSVGYRLRKFVRRNKGVLSMAAMAAGLLVFAMAALAVANQEINEALMAKSQAYDDLGVAQRETVQVNTDLKDALAELTKEQGQTKRALDEQRLALYAYRIALAHREWWANNPARTEYLLDECPEPMRHWEWHYLKRLCHAELLTMRGHVHQVNCVACSRDGRRLVSGDGAGFIHIWDAATGQCVRRIRPRSSILDVAFSPDGRRVASADHRGILITWDADTGMGILRIAAHNRQASCVAFSPDGNRLASGGSGQVKVWDAANGREVFARSLGNSATSRHLAFSSDGRLLAAGGDATIKVWDAMTGQEKLTWQSHHDQISCVAFSPDSSRLATADKDVQVWDLKSGKALLVLGGHAGQVRQVAFSSDGRQLASTDTAGRVARVWDATTGKEIVTLRGHAGTVKGLAFGPDGRLATAGGDKVVKVWDVIPTCEPTVHR